MKSTKNRFHKQPCPPMQSFKVKSICVQQEIICSSFYKEPILDLPFKDELVKELVLQGPIVACTNSAFCCVLYFDVVLGRFLWWGER